MKKRRLKRNFKFFCIFIIIIILTIILSLILKLVNKEKNVNSMIDNNTSKTTIKKNNKQKETSNKIKLTLVGDFLFESPFYKAHENGYDINSYFINVKHYFEEDDLSIGNMEVVIGDDNLKVSGDGYNFCAPKYIGDLVSSLDLEVLSTANNHAYDRGHDGIISTLDYFSNTDIKTFGTYKSVNDRNENHILNINNTKIGFLSYTLGTNQKINDNDIDLISVYRDSSTKEINKELLSNDVKKLKKESDIIIVLMHWGTEFTYEPSSEQKEVANYLSSLGVNLIVGSHSHCMQPIEMINNTLVYYSLGNFTSQDDDIARTAPGNEEFDNSYQVGLLSTLTINKDNNKITFEDIKTTPIVNYFNSSMNDFKLIPFDEYTDKDERNHLRYNKGLNKNFINTTFEKVIDSKYR